MRTVGALILAAGGSTRLGQPKQLLAIGGESLVQRAIRVATDAGCAPIVAVVGDQRERIEANLRQTSAQIVHNADWERGVGGSIRCGLGQLLKLDAVVVMACDQPLVDAALIRALIAESETSAKPIVTCSYAQTLGIPALFDRSCFEALRELPDDSGAKPLIEADLSRVARVEFEAAALDIDTPADAARLQTLD